MKTNRRESANPAAEYYAASQLSRVGWKVKITRPLGPAGTRTRRMDVVAERRGRTVRLDVRGLKNMTNWPLPWGAEGESTPLPGSCLLPQAVR